ncbi:MAG: signal recognition particle protein [Acidobacteria bacterium]|nr:MAG: signal recognition particle protein [Acidobacteriota bacterium]
MDVFDSLTDRLGGIFKKLRGQGHLTEANMQAGLREIRVALLEADVNFRVVRDLLARIKVKALGDEVMNSLTPGQQLLKVVRDEMIGMLGGEHQELKFASRPPTVILMAGLQGSGKTTTAAKLARRLKARGKSPLLVPADLSRPAAIEQLRRLGEQAGVPVFPSTVDATPLGVAEAGVRMAREKGHDPVIVDTAGRLHVDEELMAELRSLRDATRPVEILYVADAMTGQDAVTSASSFHESLGLTGVILSKLDGDARGGGALSLRAVTGVPIRFVGTGEQVDALEPFHPDRMVSRILGMGDVLSLIEKVQAVADEKDARVLARKMRQATFTLEDFRGQLRQVQKLGPLDQLLKMMPGAGNLSIPEQSGQELKRTEAIINSMTPGERQDHTIINGGRRKRIARGSGTSVQAVNRLLKQFASLHRMMKKTGGRFDPGALRQMKF